MATTVPDLARCCLTCHATGELEAAPSPRRTLTPRVREQLLLMEGRSRLAEDA